MKYVLKIMILFISLMCTTVSAAPSSDAQSVPLVINAIQWGDFYQVLNYSSWSAIQDSLLFNTEDWVMPNQDDLSVLIDSEEGDLTVTLDAAMSTQFQSLADKIRQQHQVQRKRQIAPSKPSIVKVKPTSKPKPSEPDKVVKAVKREAPKPKADIQNTVTVQPKVKPTLPKPTVVAEESAPRPKPQIPYKTNTKKRPSYRERLRDMATQAALRHGLDPALFRALIHHESTWRPKARSKRDAVGLTQITRPVAKACGISSTERYHVKKNLNCGAWYLAQQKKRFGSYELALAAYNSGPARVARLQKVPNIFETQRYVRNVMAGWQCEFNHNKAVCK